MILQRIPRGLIVGVLLAALAACGGGGGGDNNNQGVTPPPETNWNEMDWDEGRWT